MSVTAIVVLIAVNYSGSVNNQKTVLPLPAPVASEPVSKSGSPQRPRNLIVFVADGMGFAHLSAGRIVSNGVRSAASWDRFHAYGWHQPHPADGLITDSAASATALATGVETRYGAVGIGPQGQSLTSVFDRAAELDFSLAVVTDSYIWDATPAAFVVESQSRKDAAGILQQLAKSKLDLLFGELEDVGEDSVPEWDPTIALLQERFQLIGENLALPADASIPVAAVFEEDAVQDLYSSPNLPALVAAALQRLSQREKRFLLLVESEEPDSASHDRDFYRLIRGMKSIEASLALLLDFAEKDGQTLILFTSDHETSGLALSAGDISNQTLQADWGSEYHTATAVPVMAFGPGSQDFSGIHSTAQLGQALHNMLTEQPQQPAGK